MRSRPAAALGIAAAALVAAFLVCHALGFRDHVSVLSGTEPAAGPEAAIAGVLYVFLWLSAIVVAPILALAAVIALTLSSAALRLGGGS